MPKCTVCKQNGEEKPEKAVGIFNRTDIDKNGRREDDPSCTFAFMCQRHADALPHGG